MPDESSATDTRSGWQPGDRVRLRGGDWSVVRRTEHADCEALRVHDGPSRRARTFLLPFDRPSRLASPRVSVVSPRAWLHAFRRLLGDGYPYGGLRSCPGAIDLLPYQLEPALAMLRDGHARLLVADAVGLGKTIEAGLILRELSERQEDFRALLLVPAGLRQQWADELSARFDVTVIMADAAWLRSSARQLPPDVNPWSTPGVYLASFDFVKRPESLHPLEDVEWDLVVVDEAHAATVATDRRAAVDAVARRSRRVVLMTATPPSDPVQHAALCRIGAAAGDGDVAIFRRRRPADPRLARRSVVLPARPTEAERRMRRLLERYTSLVWREALRRGSGDGRLVTTILRKRALSSAASLARSLRRRRDLLAGMDVEPALQLLLPLDEDDGREDVVRDEWLGAAALADAPGERRWLDAAIEAADRAAVRASKARVLVKLLTRIREPSVVFTEYRDTLDELRGLLEQQGIPVCVVHGGLPAAARREALSAFARGGLTLLATDTAAEGLNLQRSCRVIVHYELPWNPSRMLQRAGRVDRIGQRRRVHEIALVAADTAESIVLLPLARRAARELSAGITGRMLELMTESRVTECVLGGVAAEPQHEVVDAHGTFLDLSAEAAVEAQRLQHRRGPAGPRDAMLRAHAVVPVTTIRGASLREGAALLYELKTSASHDVVERALAAVHIELNLPAGWPRHPAAIRGKLADMLPSLLAAAAPAIERLNMRRLQAVRPRHDAARVSLQARERSIRTVHESAARKLVQAGLFERPATKRGAQGTDPGLLDRQPAQRGNGRDLSASFDLRAILLVRRR